jgi:ankyrin repeat protein
MIKKLFSKSITGADNFEDILLKDKFNKDDAELFLNTKVDDINKKNSNGETFLDVCLKNNKFGAAKWLVAKGIDVSSKNKENITAIRHAVEKGEVSIIKDILKYSKFNINQVDKNGRSLLQDAVIHGHDDIAKLLINSNIDVNITDKHNRNVAFDAISYGCDKMIDEVISAENLDLNVIDKDGKTILHTQSVLNDDELAKKLLEKGANATIADKNGLSFIAYTALRGEEAEELLDLAIKTSKLADDKSVLSEVLFAFTKVSKSEQKRRDELKNVAKKLLKFGSDINIINKNGETLLFKTVKEKDMEGCAFLLENGIDPNRQNNNKETPLMYAVLNGADYLDIILLLLESKADPTIKNRHGQSLPEILNEVILYVHGKRKLNYQEIQALVNPNGKYMVILKELLSIKDMDYSYLDSRGDPLFFLPFMYNDIKTTKLYFKHGLNVNARNTKNHNLFYEYVLKCFKRGLYFKEFRENLVFLLVHESDIDAKNKHGQTIYSRVALIPKCDLKLFRKLIEVTRHDYTSIDNLGRTIIHSCVISDNVDLLSIVYGVERNIQNIADIYNLLPITYAALQGNFHMVHEFLKRESIITSGKPIAPTVKKKFQPLLKNLDQLLEKVEDEDLIRKLEMLIEQVRLDFKI